MPDQKPQAKIPVKKSDGTTVFLTMDEFKEYKKNAASVAAPVAPAAPEVKPATPKKLEQGKIEKIESPALPVVQSTHTELASTTPVKDIFFEEAAAKAPVKTVAPEPPKVSAPAPKPTPAPEPVVLPAAPPKVVVPPTAPQPEWKTTDHSSLLESDVAEEKKSTPLPNPAVDNSAVILAKVKEQFPVAKDIEGRFDSLVLSRIRDVRSVIDFEQYAKESTAKGGLGLEEDQVGLLLALIAAAQKIVSPAKTTPVISRPPPPAEPSVPVQEAPKEPKITPINITPVMSTPVQKPVSPFPLPKEEYTFSPQKTIMQDVTPAARKQTMGPVDEIQYFSLTDFRRLSPKVENSKEILKGKFQSLQEESYVLFLDARDAWHDSPLFHTYQDTIMTMLQEKKNFPEALAQKTDGLTPEEVDAIVEINHYLG